MLGFYNYTVWLTYGSLVSAVIGIFVSLAGHGHPYIGAIFLLISGLCDAFDGRVARTKKDRCERECRFGVQVDSLADVVAFGVLPACIGVATLRCSPLMQELFAEGGRTMVLIARGLAYAVLLLYMLAALIRLAYFNVTEEERQRTEGGARRYFTGLPVTSAALIFPTVMLLQFITPMDITPLYLGVAVLTGFAFLAKFQMRKPGMRGVLIMVAIGAAEFIAMLILRSGLRLH